MLHLILFFIRQPIPYAMHLGFLLGQQENKKQNDCNDTSREA